MKVLWLCNVMLPVIAKGLNLEASNKEGWLSGLADAVLRRREENRIELTVAFPAPRGQLAPDCQVLAYAIETEYGTLNCYGFREAVENPHVYDEGLEDRMRKILDGCNPDVIHCFGTEYPHTLAMCRVAPQKERLLVGIQGLCAVCANAYYADLPEKVIRSVTLRDFLKGDSLIRQQRKFVLRGEMEKQAVRLAGNITGRTDWDRFYTGKWNPGARYFLMNETLRADFYGAVWNKEDCMPHSIFVSQGDMPLKGLHYLLNALPAVMEEYPDTHVYVAGADITQYKSWKQKLKISAYGKYLRRLLGENGLTEHVTFLGRLSGAGMKEQYLRSHLYVCCSSIENSPNSLGEAMLLGMPCVSADVGGIASIFTGGEDGILYRGFRSTQNEFDNTCDLESDREESLKKISKRLSNAIIEIWSDEEKMSQYCENARKHAKRTHDRDVNYEKMKEIYSIIVADMSE
ncbi:MAG: glycosyltransferase family 4 protein [bacterium]|nr:glycosyltransferase family 4 protein [bacterium]